jgi:hypothetical protein
MTSSPPPYAARFNYGRLFADCGRVLARAWLAVAIGVVVLGIAPSVVVALPWWQVAPDAPGMQQIWLAYSTAQTLVLMVANSAREVFIAAVALQVLAGQGSRDLLQARRLAAALTTALAIDVLANCPALAGPVLQVLDPYDVLARLALTLAAPACLLLILPFFGIAVTAAVAEDRWIAPAAGRSLRLLRGLRWRMVALAFGYLVCLWVSGVATAIILLIARAPYTVPWLRPGAVSISAQLLAALFDIAFVAFFLQARRIADGPSAGELHEVFA